MCDEKKSTYRRALRVNSRPPSRLSVSSPNSRTRLANRRLLQRLDRKADAFAFSVDREHFDFDVLPQRHGFGWIAQDINPDGAVGDASAATAEKGRLTAEHQAEGFIALLRDVARFPLNELA